MPMRLQAIELTSSAINVYTYQYNDKAGLLAHSRVVEQGFDPWRCNDYPDSMILIRSSLCC